MRVLNRAFEHPLPLEEHAAMPLAGGIMLRGYQCGMLWGSALAAGLAGGIGLAGGGCGALGAAVWLINMNSVKEGSGTISYRNRGALAAIDRFTKSTGGSFECASIVGRKFENIGDHASYLRAGGCSPIIEALATT